MDLRLDVALVYRLSPSKLYRKTKHRSFHRRWGFLTTQEPTEKNVNKYYPWTNKNNWRTFVKKRTQLNTIQRIGPNVVFVWECFWTCSTFRDRPKSCIYNDMSSRSQADDALLLLPIFLELREIIKYCEQPSLYVLFCFREDDILLSQYSISS